MDKRKVSILEPAATAVAENAWFIENKGLLQTAKKFVDNAFQFFDKLSDQRIEHKPRVAIINRETLAIVVYLTKRNILLLISARRKKLLSVILFPQNF
jgi:hypothetical protein